MTKPIFITTSIPYINAEPHIGHLLEWLSADVLARSYKQAGQEVFFLSGTDEHGQKVEQAAKAANLSTKEYSDQLAEKFQQVVKDFQINFDYFIRTTDPAHQQFVQDCWVKLREKNILEKRTYSGWYCVGCEAFKTEKEIIDGKCVVHQQPVEKIEEENWFFKLSQFKSEILTWIDSGAVKPEGRAKEIRNIVEELEDISVSRPKAKVSWGVPVPEDDEQVIYVWFDALFNYLSALEINNKTELWPADIQIIGKDILRFHAAIWPGLLLGLGKELPKQILVHGFINVDGQKMSSSRGNFVTPQQLLDRYKNPDAVRYLLLRQLSFWDDSNFVWAEFDSLYEGELANGLGNLVARVIGLLKRTDGAKVPIKLNQTSLEDIQGNLIQANDLLNEADKAISENKLWEDLKEGSEKENILNRHVILKLLGALQSLNPIIPTTVSLILDQLESLESQPLFPRL